MFLSQRELKILALLRKNGGVLSITQLKRLMGPMDKKAFRFDLRNLVNSRQVTVAGEKVYNG